MRECKAVPLLKILEVILSTILRRLQQGENLGMPHSRPMPSVGVHCHEL
jgi:hypothetical protein